MKMKLFLYAVLVLSLSANVYYWVTHSYTTLAHAICDDEDISKPIHGALSEKFLDALTFAPYSYTAYVRYRDRKRVVRIPVIHVARWANVDGYEEIMNRSIKHLDWLEQKNGIKSNRTEPNCHRMARWLFKPVGRSKKIDCRSSECRVLGVMKDSKTK